MLGKIKVLGKQEVYDHLNELFSSARASYAAPSPTDPTSDDAGAGGGGGGGGGCADMTIAGARTEYPRSSWILTAESFIGIGGDRGDDCVSEQQFVELMGQFAPRMKAVPGLKSAPGLSS